MSRKSARETAMKLLYEYSITGALSKDSLHDAPDVLDFEQLDEENLHYIDQVIDGETVAEVLDYVQYNPKKLVRTLETWVTKSVKEGKISVEEGKEFLSNYRSGLYGYTYLE